MDELVDIVDKQGNRLGSTLKSQAHAKGLLHTTVIAGVHFGENWAMIRQSADRQDAGQLVLPVGGHVQAGETELEALAREVYEEIGVRNFTHRFVGKARFHRHVLGRNENHLFVVYEITTAEPIILGEEAVELITFTPQELHDALTDSPGQFGDAFHFTLEQLYPHLLPPAWQWHWS